jgi:cobalt/nickel transport system permease protein
MLLPSFINGNINNSILIIMKVFGSILSANILSYTTKWNYITKSLKLFLVPDIFCLY